MKRKTNLHNPFYSSEIKVSILISIFVLKKKERKLTERSPQLIDSLKGAIFLIKTQSTVVTNQTQFFMGRLLSN